MRRSILTLEAIKCTRTDSIWRDDRLDRGWNRVKQSRIRASCIQTHDGGLAQFHLRVANQGQIRRHESRLVGRNSLCVPNTFEHYKIPQIVLWTWQTRFLWNALNDNTFEKVSQPRNSSGSEFIPTPTSRLTPALWMYGLWTRRTFIWLSSVNARYSFGSWGLFSTRGPLVIPKDEELFVFIALTDWLTKGIHLTPTESDWSSQVAPPVVTSELYLNRVR